ncbi:MAG: hypothetical protein WA001_01640 [Patescibacteria group bacterium]
MPIPWAVIIAIGLLGFALLIKYFFDDILEEDNGFFILVFAFFVVYAGAALAVGSLNPKTIFVAGYGEVTGNSLSLSP